MTSRRVLFNLGLAGTLVAAPVIGVDGGLATANATSLGNQQLGTDAFGNVQMSATTSVYTTTENLNMRTGASTSHSRILVIPKGKTVTYISKSGKWFKVTYSGKTGWVHSDYIKITKKTATTTTTSSVYTTTANLNMRKGASTSQARILTIPKGKTVSYISKSGKWFKVTYSGKTGWVHSDYIKITKKTTTTPAPTPTPTTSVYTTTENLNMRTGASTSHSRILVIPKGKTVTYISKSGKWFKVTYSGKTGWVHSDYIKITKKTATPAPKPTPTPTPTPTPAPVTIPKSFTIAGSGFGHGVGMSQYGAYELARQGKSVEQILQYYYSGTAVGQRTTPEEVTVQVFGPDPYSSPSYADKTNTTKVSLSAGNWRLLDHTGKVVASGTKDDALTMTVSGNNAQAKVGSSTYTASRLTLQWSGTRYFESSGTAGVMTIQGSHGTYRHGQLEVTSIGGKLNIVNTLRLNTEYLYGLAEMPSSWGRPTNGGAAALQSQAVVGRSYALLKMRTSTANPNGLRRDACDCHIVDDVRDQHFTGWRKESETSSGVVWGSFWKSAVDATVSSPTNAKVLTYNGNPIQTYYYSSSGGITADNKDVWGGTQLPHHKSVADPYSLNAPGNSMKAWTRTWNQSDAAAYFGLPNVVKIEVTERYSSGQAKTLRATSSTGATSSKTQTADNNRIRIRDANGSALPASWITSIKPNN